MISVCLGDKSFNSFSLDCYSYPSRWSPSAFGRISNLQELSRGLETEIRARHSDRPALVIVAHSLGGLVARQYIINVLKSKQKLVATKLMLVAVPHTGATLANVATSIYGYHPQVSQLCKNADLLQIQNEDWIRLEAEKALEIRYVVGGADAIVGPDSASPFLPAERLQTLIGSNHRSIVEPANSEDMRFLVLKQFVQENAVAIAHPFKNVTALRRRRLADVLFDLYSTEDDVFYLKRQLDARLDLVSGSGHVWITGESGVGKTSAARRVILSASRQIAQINLGGCRVLLKQYFDDGGTELMAGCLQRN